MPKQEKTENTTIPEKKERRPSPARQTLIDAAAGRETILHFDSEAVAKGAAYGWWGARRRAGLTEKVAINLDRKAMTVTIGPRTATEAEATASETAAADEPEAEAAGQQGAPESEGSEAESTEAALEP